MHAVPSGIAFARQAAYGRSVDTPTVRWLPARLVRFGRCLALQQGGTLRLSLARGNRWSNPVVGRFGAFRLLLAHWLEVLARTIHRRCHLAVRHSLRLLSTGAGPENRFDGVGTPNVALTAALRRGRVECA